MQTKILYFCSRKTEDDSLAQQEEHHTFNVGVLGSSPRRVTTATERFERNAFLVYLFC